MEGLIQLLGENVPKVVTGAATAGVIALFTYLYRAGSWTKDHRRARLFEEHGDRLVESGLVPSAIEQYKAANKIWEQEVNNAKMLSVYQKVGKAYKALGDTEQALDAFTHCEMLWEALKKEVKIYDIYFELSQIYANKKDLERAGRYITMTIEMLRKQGSPRLPLALSLAARISKERGRLEEAEDEYVEAIRFLDNIGDTFGLAAVYYELGDLKHSQQRDSIAAGYYGKSADAYDKLGSARAAEIRTKLQTLPGAG